MMKTGKALSIGYRIFQILIFISIFQGGVMRVAASGMNDPFVLHVGYVPVMSQLPLVISYDFDRYSYHNVRVELIEFKSYITLEAALRVGAIDVAYLPIPTILAMKADGVDVVIGENLHRSGVSLVLRAGYEKKTTDGALFGISGLVSNDLLRLQDFLMDSLLCCGTNYKTVTVQLSDSVAAINNRKIDGVFLPEPYATQVMRAVPRAKRILRIKQPHATIPPAALVFNRKKIAGNIPGLMEWLASVENSCAFLEKDMKEFGGAQTILTQQLYFSFDLLLVNEALNYTGSSLVFSPHKLTLSVLKKIVEKMISEKLLLNSIILEDILLNTYLP